MSALRRQTPNELGGVAGKQKISIIMPNLNGEKYIASAIESFLAQKYSHKELIIIDAKSTDLSHKIIRSFAEQHSNVVWLQREDRGISHAFNCGLEVASGDFVGYLGSDDLLLPDILELIDTEAHQHECDAIYFDSFTYYVHENKKIFRKCPSVTFNRKNLLRYGTIVGWQDIFFRKHVYDRHKLDETNRYSMDYELYLRISEMGYRYHYVTQAATVNIFDNNISNDIDGKQERETYRVFCNYAQWYEKHYWLERKLIQRSPSIARILGWR